MVAEVEKVGAPYHAWVLEELAERPLTGFAARRFWMTWKKPGVDLCGAGADGTSCSRACR